MRTLKATIKDGRLEVDTPPDWPDGTEVEIHPIQCGATGGTRLMSPEEIAKTPANRGRASVPCPSVPSVVQNSSETREQ